MNLNNLIMKKLLFVILAIVFTTGMKAQETTTPAMVSDTTSVMFQNLANTNARVAEINNDLRLHSQLALGAFAFEGVGALLFYYASNENKEKTRNAYQTYGAVACAAGAVMFVCSYIPIFKKEVKVDERGFVLSIPIDK